MKRLRPRPKRLTVEVMAAAIAAETASHYNEPAYNRATSIHGALTALGTTMERRRQARGFDPEPPAPAPSPDDLEALLAAHGKQPLGDDVHGHYRIIWERHRRLPPL